MKRSGTVVSAVLALGLCLLVAPVVAHAQTTNDNVPELSQNWNVRIGPFFYGSSAARRVNGDVGISGLVERSVYRGDQFDVNVGIGYNGYDRIYSVPLDVYAIAHPNNVRIGAGVGYSFNKRVSGAGSNGMSYCLILGYQFTHGKNPVSADLRYYGTSGNSSEVDGYSFTFGIGF